MELVVLLALAAVAVALYFRPCLIAGWRDHPQSGPILVVNFFLGWTGIGWVVALAWSLSSISRRQPSSARHH
jgi:hypothetical protein